MTPRRPDIVFFPRSPGYTDPLDAPGYVRSEVFELDGAGELVLLHEVIEVSPRRNGLVSTEVVSEILVSHDRKMWQRLERVTTPAGSSRLEHRDVRGWRYVRAALSFEGSLGTPGSSMVGYLAPAAEEEER